MNLKTKEFEQKLIELINQSGIPAINIRYVIEGVYRQILDIEREQIEQERKQLEESTREEE